VTGAAYENERLANTVFVLGTVSSGRAVERVWRVAAWMDRQTDGRQTITLHLPLNATGVLRNMLI